MKAMNGVAKNKHGVYYVRVRVPKGLEEATARRLDNGKARQVFLKRTLNTKDLREANIRAKPVLIEFDKIIAQAEALVAKRPLRTSLHKREIKQIADFYYAHELASDDEDRLAGGSEAGFQDIARQLDAAGVEYHHNFPIGGVHIPEFGLSKRDMYKRAELYDTMLPVARDDLARGDFSALRFDMDELLDLHRINLDRTSGSYRELGMAMLRVRVKTLEALAHRHLGEVVETPELIEPQHSEASSATTLKASYEGWKKAASRPENTLREFGYALARFLELHGDLEIARITRRHTREFREALQEMPLRRSGALRTATLSELVEWSKQHPSDAKASPETVNKLLGAVGAVAQWGRDNGLIADDVQWSNPFSKMSLPTRRSTREPWETDELRTLFGSPIFTGGERPQAGGGEAAFWLPVLALFTGARLNELAPLTVEDVKVDEASGIHFLNIREVMEQGRRLKTAGSARVIPVHHELVRIGFLRFADTVRTSSGSEARLFPLLTPGPKGGFGEAWSKWFGRYKRSLGITNKASVFHSFRHGFKDALRSARVSEDVNDALTGHSSSSIGRSYGAKDMVRRFGLRTLADAVGEVAYPGLDLGALEWSGHKQGFT
jgi:integrase